MQGIVTIEPASHLTSEMIIKELSSFGHIDEVGFEGNGNWKVAFVLFSSQASARSAARIGHIRIGGKNVSIEFSDNFEDYIYDPRSHIENKNPIGLNSVTDPLKKQDDCNAEKSKSNISLDKSPSESYHSSKKKKDKHRHIKKRESSSSTEKKSSRDHKKRTKKSSRDHKKRKSEYDSDYSYSSSSSYSYSSYSSYSSDSSYSSYSSYSTNSSYSSDSSDSYKSKRRHHSSSSKRRH